MLVLACISCDEDSAGPPSAWTYEVPGTVELSTGVTFSATLLVTVAPFCDGSPTDEGIPRSIGWSDACAVDLTIHDQDTTVPDACGYLYEALVSRTGQISSPILPSCALPTGTATSDLPIQTSSVTLSPDSQALQLAVQAGGDGESVDYSFTSEASIPPPPAPGSAPCQED